MKVPMAEPRKRKLSKADTKKVMPKISEFNSLSKMLLKLLGQKIDQKEKKLAGIKVMVTDMGRAKIHGGNISIQTIDINETRIKKKGDYSYNQVMGWEAQMRRQKKGLML